jgi:murein L,D-transpeptidase YcbB/YkuD
MKMRGFRLVVAAVIAMVFAAGCSTLPRKYRDEMAGMKTKVDTLESRVETVESKQADVEKAAVAQGQTIEELKAERQKEASRSNVTILDRTQAPERTHSKLARTRDIQTALRNAGFYKGRIDGVKGEQTKAAIREFQRANGLRDDGVVGPKTWEILQKNLSGAAPQAAAAPAPAAGAGSGGASESAAE